MLSLFLAVIFLFSLVSCKAQNTSDKTALQPSRSQYYAVSAPPTDFPDFNDTDEFSYIPKLDKLPDYINNNPKLYTNLLSNMLKIYYTGIISGSINSETYKPQYSDDILPSKDASAEERRSTAGYCTIGGAIEYCTKDGNPLEYYKMYNGCLPYFCNDRDGNIYLLSETDAGVWALTGYSEVLRYIFKFANTDNLEKEAMNYISTEVESAVKNYYSGIKSGKINTDTFSQKYTHDILPDKNDSQEYRTTLARHATVGGALEYAGFYRSYSVFVTKLGYDGKTIIFAMSNIYKPDLTVILSLDMPLSKIYVSD